MKKMRMMLVFLLIISMVLIGCNKKDTKDKLNSNGELSGSQNSTIETPGEGEIKEEKEGKEEKGEKSEAETSKEGQEENSDDENSQNKDSQEESNEEGQLEEETDNLGEPEFSSDDGYQMLANVITPNYFTIELKDDSFEYEESFYYVYTVTNTNNNQVDQIIVDMYTGKILCYTGGKASDFEEFLFENIISGSSESNNGLSQSEATALLTSISHEVLGLEKPITEYTLVFDEYTSHIEGKESYCINVYSKEGETQVGVGAYYVALDGSSVYSYDPLEDMMIELLH